MGLETEYLAAAAGMAETYGGTLPRHGSVVWYRYGRGLSSGVVAGLCDDGGRAVLVVQRSATESLRVAVAELVAPPRFFSSAYGYAPVVGELVWFRVAGGQSRGVVEAVNESGLVVREAESGELVGVDVDSVLPF